jgi:proton-translocating NADH-quinone oxidoreductase chain L
MNIFEKFIVLLVFQPLLTSIILFFFGNIFGVKGTVVFVTFFNFVQLIFFWFYYINFFFSTTPTLINIDFGIWFYFDDISSHFNFIFDGLSMLMIQLVLAISFITQVYSFFYMKNDPNVIRFLSYLSLFTFFMLVLITADNLILFFLGWEGVGLCSYLLIGFWDSRAEARSAALKAVAVNRIGDCFFIAGVSIIIFFVRSVEFSIIFLTIKYFKESYIQIFSYQIQYFTIICSFFIIAIMAKSSQLGLHIWLADAMEGPTPVSALIHAATMVTAGIYFMLRFSIIFELTENVQNFIALTGAFTAFFGASVAAFQYDVKKIIAYSTCSQLGYMICICGFGGYKFAFYHLITHGYFKALLFFSAGILIHNFQGEQDIRKMGGLYNLMPLTFSFFIVGLSCLMGLPGTSGFDSKEKILDYISIQNSYSGTVSYFLLLFAMSFTIFYSCKLIYYIFFQVPNGSWPKYKYFQTNSKEIPNYVSVALLFLSFFSLFIDSHIQHLIVGTGNSFLNNSFFFFNIKNEELFIESFAYKNRVFPFFFIFIGFFFFYLSQSVKFNFYQKKMNDYKINIIFFFQKAWYIDYAIMKFFSVIFIFFVNSSFYFDKGVSEWIGPYGISKFINSFSNSIEFYFNIKKPSIFSTISILFIIHFFFIFFVFFFNI